MRLLAALGVVALLAAVCIGYGVGQVWVLTTGTQQLQAIRQQAQAARQAQSLQDNHQLSADYILQTMRIPSEFEEPDEPELATEQEHEPLQQIILTTEELLGLSEKLFLNATSRDIPAALQQLQQVAAALDLELPKERHQRTLVWQDSQPLPEELPLPDSHPSNLPIQTAEVEAAGTAVYFLSALLATGIVHPLLARNDSAAVELAHMAARAGSLLANCALMDRYEHGRGVPKSCRESLRRAREVADVLVHQQDLQGEPEPLQAGPYLRARWRDADYSSPYAAGMRAMDQDKLSEVLLPVGGFGTLELPLGGALNDWSWLTPAALAAEPQRVLGLLHQAAQDGDAHALANLGHMQMSGLYLPQNATEARILLLTAAELGSASAFNGLGVMHMQGIGVPVNYTRARHLFEMGASMDEPNCFFNLGILHSGGLGTEVDHAQALLLLQSAFELHHWRAPYQLAIMYEQGFGVPRNCSAALEYLHIFLAERTGWVYDMLSAVDAIDSGDAFGALVRMAMVAEQGSSLAQANLGWMLAHGQGYNASDRRDLALELHLRAGANPHLPQELVEAGLLLHADGELERSASLWEVAASRGDVEGQYLTGWLAEQGVLGTVDLSLAKERYRQAVAMSIDEHEAIAPFLALMALHIK
ncbi:hypothetical protein WJX73_007841 [Symbiochloris irregularis]|uniref:Sel1 repeat family protein n=1 Tax=Symbiochloris irregularis TaxID=706552 RepID=A0AAW1PJQ9_9CHLO